jgi:hypothetical protein
MRFIKSLSFILILAVLGSCNLGKKKGKEAKILNDYFKKEIEAFEEGNYKLFKTTYYDNEISDTLILSPDWEGEFKLFEEYLPEQNKLDSGYLHKTVRDGDRRKEIYTNKKVEDRVRAIELSYIRDSLYSVRVSLLSKDKLSRQSTTLNYLSGKSIGTKGEVELFSRGTKEFEIFAEIRK